MPENLLFHFRDEVALGAGVLPIRPPGRFLLSAGFVLGFDLRRCPVQADKCVAALVVSQQDVDVGGGKRALVTQVGHVWGENKRQKKKKDKCPGSERRWTGCPLVAGCGKLLKKHRCMC